MNRTRRRGLKAVAAAATAPLAGRADAADLDGPVRVLVPFGAGGVADLSVRAVVPALSAALGVPVVVENRPGAGGVVAGQQVATAKPDGRTLLLVSNGTAISATLFRALPFDTLKAFAPIGTLGGFPIAIIVPAASRWRTLADLLAAARAEPGRLNVGTIAIGSTQNLSAELFKTGAGIDVRVVPFNSTPALITAVRAGHVDAGFEIVGPVVPQLRPDALRALAVTSAARSPALPDVPTVIESGVAGYDVVSWNGLAAPVGTPPAVIERLRAGLAGALADPGVQQRLRSAGVEPLPGTPEALGRRLADEITRWAAVIERAGIERQ